jgi:centrosomal protein CEP120
MKIKNSKSSIFFRSKNQALEDEIIRLKRSVAEWEKRYRDKEQEYFSFKEKQRSTPEVKLQADINMLTLEKVNDFIYYFFVFF